MDISIVTPSFRNSDWLKSCVASVADQKGVEHEHIVQDSCSDDGTQDWLPHDPRVKAFIEKDTGMYDGVNRGIRRASGDLVAYLNCDEQYLPGALQRVVAYFDANPKVDILVADMVVVADDGSYICSRVGMTPIAWHMVYRFSIPTAALFMRRRVFSENGLWFDTSWKTLSDFTWIEETCRRGVRWGEMRWLTSAFTETGDNLGLSPTAAREYEGILQRVPAWQRLLRPMIVWHHRARMAARGAFTAAPFRYQIFTRTNPTERTTFIVEKPTGIWQRNFPKRA